MKKSLGRSIWAGCALCLLLVACAAETEPTESAISDSLSSEQSADSHATIAEESAKEYLRQQKVEAHQRSLAVQQAVELAEGPDGVSRRQYAASSSNAPTSVAASVQPGQAAQIVGPGQAYYNSEGHSVAVSLPEHTRSIIGSKGTGELKANSGVSFYILEFTVRNNSKESLTVNPALDRPELVESSGMAYGAELQLGMNLPGAWTSEVILPGESRSGKILFIVPDTVSELSLKPGMIKNLKGFGLN